MAATIAESSRVRFTNPRVESFACPPGKSQAFLWDTDSKGLGLRVTRNGARTYVYQFRLHGKTGRISIGSPKVWSLAEARTEAKRLGVLVDSGQDPRIEKEEQARAHREKHAERERQTITLGEVWSRYIEDRRAYWGGDHLRAHQRALQPPGQSRPRSSRKTVAGPLWPLRDKRLVDLTQGTLRTWLESESAKRPTTTAQYFRLLRAFLRWCDEQEPDSASPHALDLRGLVPPNALSRRVKQAVPRKQARTDRLERGDLATWFEYVGKIERPAIRAYLKTLFLTGARRTETLELRWENVDFRRRTLTIRDKAASHAGQDGTRTIPLTPYVAELLRELYDLNQKGPSVRHLRKMEARGETWEPSPWVFSSLTSRTGRLQEPRIAHNRAVADAGLPHLTLHGLRRTFALMAEAAGAPAGAIAQIQGHRPSGTVEQHYKRRSIEELRDIHGRIEAWILEQAGTNPPPFESKTPGLRVVEGGAA